MMNESRENRSREAVYDSADVIDLREYWFIFRQNLNGILGFTFIVSAIGIMVILSMPSIYQATATLLIESNEPKVVSVEAVSVMGVGKSEYYATQFEILKSRELAETVIKRNLDAFEDESMNSRSAVGINSILNFLSPKKNTRGTGYFARDFFGRLTITPIKATQLVKISYESTDPRFSARIANEVAKAYIEYNLDARVQMTQQAAAWLADKSDRLRDKLVSSEQELQAYRESEELVDSVTRTTGKTLATTELEVAASKLAEARQRRTQAENIASQISQLPDHKIETLATIPAVLQHSLVQRLKEQEGVAEQKLSELSRRYGEKHPKIIAAKSDLDAAKRNVADQILKVVEGINKEAEVARATEKDLEQQMADLKKKTQGIKRKEYRLDELEREVAVNKQLYETFLSRMKETSEGGDMVTANARVIDHAVVSMRPVKPRRMLLSMLVVVFSFIVAVVIAFIKEAFDSTVRSKDDVLFKLHSQLLGVLPMLRDQKEESESSPEYIKNISGAFAESIRTIRTGVVLSGLDNPHKILVVTSSVPGEGKTTVSTNLAAAFGQVGKTLLIDADMRRPSIAKNFGIKLASPGLSNLVAETAGLEECIHRVEAMGIDIITAGMLPPNPLELLSSKRFAAVLAELEKHYDRIIIDSTPCEVVSDALILSTYANAVIYVVKADATNIRVVKSGVSRLRDAKAPVTGIVLNQVNIDKKARDGSYGQYYGGYYDYYGYSGPATEEKKS